MLVFMDHEFRVSCRNCGLMWRAWEVSPISVEPTGRWSNFFRLATAARPLDSLGVADVTDKNNQRGLLYGCVGLCPLHHVAGVVYFSFLH